MQIHQKPALVALSLLSLGGCDRAPTPPEQKQGEVAPAAPVNTIIASDRVVGADYERATITQVLKPNYGMTVQARNSAGRVFTIDLYDNDNGRDYPGIEGVQTMALMRAILEPGVEIEFPTRLTGKVNENAFNSDGIGAVDVDLLQLKVPGWRPLDPTTTALGELPKDKIIGIDYVTGVIEKVVVEYDVPVDPNFLRTPPIGQTGCTTVVATVLGKDERRYVIDFYDQDLNDFPGIIGNASLRTAAMTFTVGTTISFPVRLGGKLNEELFRPSGVGIVDVDLVRVVEQGPTNAK